MDAYGKASDTARFPIKEQFKRFDDDTTELEQFAATRMAEKQKQYLLEAGRQPHSA